MVTGQGAVTPFGMGADSLWSGVSRGRSAVRSITGFETTGMPVTFAGEVDDFDPSKWVGRDLPATRDKSLKMVFVAASEALRQAGLFEPDQRPENLFINTVVGTGLGPCFEAEYSYGCFFTQGWKSVRPTTVPRSMFNSFASQLSIEFGLTGMNQTVACACASGASAIGHAYQLIERGSADVVLTGGVDSPLSPAMFAAWTNLRVLARHEEPERACRPFDRDRSGLVLGDGAGMLVLEAEEHALSRGVQPLAEVRGFGSSSDSSHLTAPTVDGPVRAIRSALLDAGLRPDDVDYVNAHGTATLANDENEAHALHEVFGRRGASLPISSSKSMLGHSMGASSALEAIICVESIRNRWVVPTLNCDHPEPGGLDQDFVPGQGRSHRIRHAVSNSFGFGGANCVLVMSGVEG
ncbi:MAG: beta-ketoacyl-[acyl-carrier-protein] synthase family protein [Planctomycetaceae bacterium]|nr:beta-ketoacyl-[acyl-carrier-protein] synthase family protein [Planctomycetaceae bacterium]